MERRAIHDDPDGYYFRSPTGKLYGPLSRFQFEAWSMRGAVGPGSKVWRQQGAHHYRVEISRRLKWQKLLSVRSCGAMSDWLMTFISVVSLVFLFSVKKLRDDLRKELLERKNVELDASDAAEQVSRRDEQLEFLMNGAM